MGHPVLQLSNAANWQDVYNQSFTAQRINPTVFAPLPEIIVPVLFDRHIIAVYATSSSAKPNWYFAGFLNQKIRLGLIPGGSPDADAVQRRKIWLNRITLLFFPKITSTYAVSFNVPKWFDTVNLNIFEYQGTESDSTEDLIRELFGAE
jgi:hypothetical protein